MDTVSRLLGFTGNQPLKAHGNNAKQNTDIEDVERSDDAESEAMAQVGRIKTSERSKTTLLKKSDEPHKPQQRNNEPSLAQRHQQLGKREVTEAKRLNTELTETKKLNIELTETKKRNIELTESLQNISKDLPMAQERYNSLLREHKARLDGVEELALARKTANDLREALRRSEANSRTHQKETAILKAALEDQKVDLDRMMGLKVAAEHKSEQARSEFETVRRQLRLCKDDLFRLQPMAQLPDTEIVKDFESICQDIIGWIDVEVSAFEKSYPSAVPSQIFSGGCNPDAIHLLEHFPTFGEYFVRYVVHYCLYNAMFSRSVYLLGLPKEVKKCLQAAEHRMATLEPPRGTFSSING